jgi:BNR repeat-like domain
MIDFKFIKIFISLLTFVQAGEVKIPVIPGIEVTMGETIVLPTTEKVNTAIAFKFSDGRIICGDKKNTLLSEDGGHTWKPFKEVSLEKAMINLDNGEILAIGRNSHRKENGKFKLSLFRSGDYFQTIEKEEAELDLPGASFTVTGSGNRVDGFLFHHGILQLDNGDLIGSMYGNYEGDTELCAGYPTELNQRKYHTIVVFSQDRGRTWGGPVHVAYNKMLGRGIPDNHAMIGKSIPVSMVNRTSVVPAVTQEGFRESELVKASNGDLLCIMRSGGRNPIEGVALFPTPLYCSRSEDSGKSWSPPMQIADRGVSPYAVTLKNGITVCTYSRPGNWLIFSVDNGNSWKGAFQFADGNATNYIIASGPDTVQVFYEADENGTTVLRTTFFTVKKTAG